MLNIFYQNNIIKDTLMINLSLLKPNQVISKKDITLGLHDNNLVFINIFNASKYIDNLQPGLLFPSKELLNKIKEITSYDLSSFFNNGFKISHIVECDDIKETHLHKCKVDIGNNQIIDVVCGANNARVNIKVVCALAYTSLPNGKTIVPNTIFGHQTNAMLCSYNELNLKQTSPGIIELSNGNVGDYFFQPYTNITNLFTNTKTSK